MKFRTLLLFVTFLTSQNIWGQNQNRSWWSQAWRVQAGYPFFLNQNLDGQFEIGVEKGIMMLSESGKFGLRSGIHYRQFATNNSGNISNLAFNIGPSYVYYLAVEHKLNLSAQIRTSMVFNSGDSPSYGLHPLVYIEYITLERLAFFIAYEYFNQNIKNNLTNGYETNFSNIITGGIRYHIR